MPAFVRAGEKGVDFSFARPPAARLIELGYTFVVGYISVPPASASKNLSRAECEAYIDAGLKVLLVWEMSATSPDGGAALGAKHGTDAKRQALARGYPLDVPILVADDTNTTAANVVAHEAYVRAFAEACAPYTIGIYGDTDILARCEGLWQIGWLPNAWSWSGSSRKDAEAKAAMLGVHVLQRKGFHIDNLWAVDPNDAIADFPAWGAEPAPWPPPTPPQGDDMSVVIYDLREQDSDCVFIGEANDRGLNLAVWWLPLNQAGLDYLAHAISLGGVETKASVGNMKDRRLLGTMPYGDTQHTWRPEDWFNEEELRDRDKPTVGHDEVARKGVEFCKAELATQAAQIDATAMRDERDRALFVALGSD